MLENQECLGARFEDSSVQLGLPFEGILWMPAQNRNVPVQTHYALDLSNGVMHRVCVPLPAELAVDLGGPPPLGFPSHSGWRQFSIGPHSVIRRGTREFEVGQRCYPRFVSIDLVSRQAFLKDPGIGGEFLSCTNWFDSNRSSLYFASWPIEGTLRRDRNPEEHVRTTIWRRMNDGTSTAHWQGEFGDLLHQVGGSPDDRLLVLCEMGMRARLPVPLGHPGTYPKEWAEFHRMGVTRSAILFLDAEKGNVWTVYSPVATAAHVEFDPLDPTCCFISCHNLALLRGANAIFGGASILRYRITTEGPRLEAAFTHPEFFRATSHQVFRFRGETLIAVTGFPDKVLVLDGRTMKLRSLLRLYSGSTVDTHGRPHFCVPDLLSPYGIAPSPDGSALFIVGSGTLTVVDLASGEIIAGPIHVFQYPDEEVIAGHLSYYA
jgi:hypothetical protein